MNLDTNDKNMMVSSSTEDGINNNIFKIHAQAIAEYEKTIAEEDSDDEGPDSDDIIKPPTMSIQDEARYRRKHFPDLTNNDVKKMASIFNIDLDPTSPGNYEMYFGAGGGIDDGSSLENKFISGPAFVITLTHRLGNMLDEQMRNGTELTFVKQLFTNFPTLYRPKSEDAVVWVKYFIK